jgi:hypothetical protein
MDSETKFVTALITLSVLGLTLLVYTVIDENKQMERDNYQRCMSAFHMATSTRDTLLVVTASGGTCTITMKDPDAV